MSDIEQSQPLISTKDGAGNTKSKQYSKYETSNENVDRIEWDDDATFVSRRYKIYITIFGIILFFYVTSQFLQTKTNTPISVDSGPPVNIVFFLVDDLGYNDIGYNSFDISASSPYMTTAAKSGIILSSYYTYSQCTPTRSSLLTGMYSSSIGLQHDCITSCDPFGVPLTYPMFPEYLKSYRNYVTAMVGKWDVGHYNQLLWPTKRGFDSSLHLSCYGYLEYTQHIGSGGFHDLHDGFVNVKIGDKIRGIDVIESDYSTSLFIQRSIAIIKQHAFKLKGNIDDDSTDDNNDDDDSTDLLVPTSKYSKVVSDPPGLFLYIAWNAVHTSLSVPQGYNLTNEYIEVTKSVDKDYNPDRALLAGALKIVDNGFKSILDTLSSTDLFSNTVIVVASDNGGSVDDGGNNYPLRGGKKTNFQGGINVPAFIYSPLINSNIRGSVYYGLFHVSDWLPTLAFGLQGRKLSNGFDGLDHWSTITEGLTDIVRSNMVCSLDYLTESSENKGVTSSAASISETTGCFLQQYNTNTDFDDLHNDDMISSEDYLNAGLDSDILRIYKFIWNQEFINWLYPSFSPENFINATRYPEASPRSGAYLFEVISDPYERNNLLWKLDSEQTSVEMKALLNKILLNFFDMFCYEYSTKMVPSLWKQKQSYAKSIFTNNDDFITYWIDDLVEDSDYSNSDGSINGADCIQEEVLELILKDTTKHIFGNDDF